MTENEQLIHNKLVDNDDFGRMVIAFAGIVSTDTRQTWKYSDQARLTVFEQQYNYTLPERIKETVHQELVACRIDRFRCIQGKMNRNVLIDRAAANFQKLQMEAFRQQQLQSEVQAKGRDSS